MNESAAFAINGRFLSQRQTGVQRYAQNVTKSIDCALSKTGERGALIAPSAASNPGLPHFDYRSVGPLQGHTWEQFILPQHWQGRLLNLCNTAPAFKSDQIVCVHDANIFAIPSSYSRAFRSTYETLQPLIVRRSARVTAVSQAAARQIARYLPIALKDIVVLPNGHEHSLSWDPKRGLVAEAFIAHTADVSGRPFVLALGSRAKHKNLALLSRIAGELDRMGIDIVVAGADAGIFADDGVKETPNIRFIGRVSDDDLAYLLDRALCLAFPSLTEGFGLPIVEAMARGCPVISSNSASMPEVCGDAALMAPPDEPAIWIYHIARLQQSADLRDDLIGHGFEQVRRFSWDSSAAGYLDLLQSPLSSSRFYHAPPQKLPNTTVVVATRGRPDIVTTTVRHLLATQTFSPEALIISCVQLADAGDLVHDPAVRVLTGPPGLAAQRNTALANLPKTTEVVVFFDDDFIADRNWLLAAATTFRDESQVVGFTGHVVADGINGAAIGFEEGVNRLKTAAPTSWKWIEPFSPYGCNMAFRTGAIADIRFDERLVLYGWLEDRDFAAALGTRGGRLVKAAEAFGVHMGVKGGRVSGDRLGYSQIVNPIYMYRKGTMSLKRVFTHIGGNMANNFRHALRPEPFVDRRGRVRGNLVGIFDVLRGCIEPERAANLAPNTNNFRLNPEIKSK